MKTIAIAMTLVLLGACNAPQQQQNANEAAPAAPANDVAPSAPVNEMTNKAQAVKELPLAEPTGAIDPKSAEAAAQVAQHYGALIEQHRNAEAAKLWGDSAAAEQFALQLKRYLEVHFAVGKPGDMEGAAGSIYVTVPVAFYGKDQNNHDFRRSAEMVLRRVNDVPGSTEAQRRWHIERIDWASNS